MQEKINHTYLQFHTGDEQELNTMEDWEQYRDNRTESEWVGQFQPELTRSEIDTITGIMERWSHGDWGEGQTDDKIVLNIVRPHVKGFEQFLIDCFGEEHFLEARTQEEWGLQPDQM